MKSTPYNPYFTLRYPQSIKTARQIFFSPQGGRIKKYEKIWYDIGAKREGTLGSWSK